MDRSDIIDSRQEMKKGSRALEQLQQDDVVVSGEASVRALTVLQQETSFGENVFGWELQHFIMSRVGVNGMQRQAYKLRLLNKNTKERVERGINEAKINIRNIEGLARSQLSDRIQNLDVFVKGPLGLQDLPILSTVHSKSTQNINLTITGRFGYWVIIVNIQEHLILSNICFTNKSNLEMIRIRGEYEVVIRDCTFSRLSISCYKNAQVLMVNSRFLNTGKSGFCCFSCGSLLMDQIIIKDCRLYGCYVEDCGNVSIDNIQVVSCGFHGIGLWQLNGFKLRNAFVQGSRRSGICVNGRSIGEIQSAHVQGCREYGIQVWGESKVRYAQIQCNNNETGEFDIREDCEFLRMN